MQARFTSLRPSVLAALALITCTGAYARVEGGDMALCPSGAPCVDGVDFNGGDLTFHWSGRFDKLHLRWSALGGEEHPRELKGAHDHFTIHGAQRGVTYVFKISGCSSPAIGKDRCSDWDEQHYTVGAQARPPAPPAVPTTVLEPAPRPKLGAVARVGPLPPADWRESRDGAVPDNAVALGRDSDGEPLYGCSALVGPPGRESPQPGKLNRRIGACNVPWGGSERTVPAYRVLVKATAGDDFGLRPPQGAGMPDRAVPGGRDTDGQALFLCVVAMPDGSRHVGKIQPGWNRCHIGYAGHEIEAAGYQVVVRR